MASTTNQMIAPDRLKAISFFAAFPRSALRIIADRAIERRFATGDILFRAGETAAGLLVVLEGKVRVVRKATDRAQVIHVERSAKCPCSAAAATRQPRLRPSRLYVRSLVVTCSSLR